MRNYSIKSRRQAKKLKMLREISAEGLGFPNIYKVKGFSPNGMGPSGFGWLIPDWFPFLVPSWKMEALGDRHDWRYFVGGTEKDRKGDDKELRDGIIGLGRGKRRCVRNRLARISKVYFKAVDEFGDGYYNYHG